MTGGPATVELPRLCLYAHGDTVGLGHVVRTTRIAAAAVGLGSCEVSVVGGFQHTALLDLDPRIRVRQLPTLDFRSGAAANDVRAQRRRLLLRHLSESRPDVVLVDHYPGGLAGELLPVLRAAADEQWHTMFVWGIPYPVQRDVVKRPPPDVRRALARYELAIAYTDERWHPVFDAYADHGLPARRAYVGVVTGAPARPGRRGLPVVVVLDGSGWAGPPMLGAVLELLRDRIVDGQLGVRVVLGPNGSSSPALDALAEVPGCEVWQTGSVDEAIANAAFVVSRAGYNSAFEVVANPVPVIFVPFQRGQPEQMERARRLAELPGVWAVDEAAPSAEQDLSDAVHGALRLSGSPVRRELPFRTTGAAGAAALLWEAADITRRSERMANLVRPHAK